MNSKDNSKWDHYVYNHPQSTYCHLSAWREIITNTYGHSGYYLFVQKQSEIVGILPLIFIRNLFLGNGLVSMPFLTYGGILANSGQIAKDLLYEALKLRDILKASYLELRCLKQTNILEIEAESLFDIQSDKVRMILKLPESSEVLFKSFNSKLRSQIRRPQKEGMHAVLGGEELIDDFYYVFSFNMRDLGSPVHSKTLFIQILRHIGNFVRVGVVRFKDVPVAAGIICTYGDTVEIPWASSLKKFNKYSPNMLLYWSFLKYSCDSGFKQFDFGRSTPGEGTYKFKKQWGAVPETLEWIIFRDDDNKKPFLEEKGTGRLMTTAVWKKLPLSFANILGPKFRKSIPL